MENPYENVNFGTMVEVPGVIHEHTYSQTYFEACWNRGIRFIPICHYVASIARYPSDGWDRDYEDWTDETATATTTRNETGSISDFIDADTNSVVIADLPGMPNCEKAHMSGRSYHLCPLGSTFGDPGNAPILGGYDPPEGISAWRGANPILTPAQMLAGIAANTQYGGKTFVTFNHPNESKENMLDWIEESNGLIKAVAGYSSYYGPTASEGYRWKIDWLLRQGLKLMITAEVDWQGVGAEDLGCHVLLMPSNYNSLTKTQKEEAILDAHIAGEFYANGKLTFFITDITASEDLVTVTFDTVCDTVKIITNKETITRTSVSEVSYLRKSETSYIRVEAFLGTDFIFTQPIYYEVPEKANTVVLSMI
jgi:hypothetical protein